MSRPCVLMLLPVLFAGCGNNLTDPSTQIPSVVPSVAGQYSGTTRISESPGAIVWSTTTSVTQSGTTVSVEPLQLSGGQCPSSIPFGETTIDKAGSLGTKSGTFSQCHCVYNYVATGGFIQRDLQISLHATSPTECYDLRLTINLTRQ